MLTILCPITGTSYRLPNYGEAANKLEILHPLLLAPLDQLMKVQYPYDLQEQYVLVLAYLWQVNHAADDELIVWQGKPTRENFSELWLSQVFPRVRRFLARVKAERTSTAVKLFPRLRIDDNTKPENIQSWLDSCDALRNEYRAVLDYDAATTAGKLLAAHINNKYNPEAFDNPIESQKIRQSRTLKDYIERSFINMPIDKVALIGKVVFRPNDYEVHTIKQVKALILDLGYENKLEEHNQKQAILNKLDNVLAEKLTILEALEVEGDSSTLAAIRDTYSIDINGTTYQNSMLKNRLAARVIETMSTVTSTVTKYEVEPDRKDFTSDFAYKVALRLWNTQSYR